MAYVLGQHEGNYLLGIPRPQSVIPSKHVVPFGFNGFIPNNYQPPLPRKAREIVGINDVGFHKSNRKAGGNCDVVEIGKKYNYDDTRGWVEYCNCMYDRSDPLWTKCNEKFCGNICFNASGPGSAKMCCEHDNLPGFWSPYNISPLKGSPPWEDAGAGARGLPKPEAGIMADIASAVDINWDDYQPLKLWETFWANPPRYALLISKLMLVPVVGGVVGGALIVTGIPVLLIPFAIGDAEKQGKNASEALIDPVWKHAKKSVGNILQYLGQCGIGINIPCGIGIIVKRGCQDMIDDGLLTKPPGQGGAYDETFKAVVVFLAQTGDRLVMAVANAMTSNVLSSGIFGIMEAGFAAARDVVTDANTKKVLAMFTTVSSVGNVIATGVAQKKSWDLIADDIAEKLLGFRPSVFFKLADKWKAQSAALAAKGATPPAEANPAVAYATTAVAQTGGSLDIANTVVNDVGLALDALIKGIEKVSQSIGGGLDGLVQILNGAKGGITQAKSATATVTQQVGAVAQANGARPDGPLFTPATGSLAVIQSNANSKMVAAKKNLTMIVAAKQPRVLPPGAVVQPKPAIKPKVQSTAQSKSSAAPLLAAAGIGLLVLAQK